METSGKNMNVWVRYPFDATSFPNDIMIPECCGRKDRERDKHWTYWLLLLVIRLLLQLILLLITIFGSRQFEKRVKQLIQSRLEIILRIGSDGFLDVHLFKSLSLTHSHTRYTGRKKERKKERNLKPAREGVSFVEVKVCQCLPPTVCSLFSLSVLLDYFKIQLR